MNDDSRTLMESYPISDDQVTWYDAGRSAPSIPAYLENTYWWAYLHPKSFHYFEREWVVNLILWGNMKDLCDAVVAELDPTPQSRVLQVACVYGDFSNRLAKHLGSTNSTLDIVDVAQIQLKNAAKKLSKHNSVSYHHQDSSCMTFPDGGFNQTVVFFLLHEQPEDVRKKTIAEAIRVTRPGGKIIFVDYHKPGRWNPMRYLMQPIFTWLEPFAMDLWRHDIASLTPEGFQPQQVTHETYFGGLYQKVVITR
jgi:ubiquinone/menaquinone biosynthesis C-methylase UbiE